eukprot:m.109946 g.109946  ORF g.109946 m.109946 type:complete len:92 (+) comp14323_c0_seq4:1992-2267(+)
MGFLTVPTPSHQPHNMPDHDQHNIHPPQNKIFQKAHEYQNTIVRLERAWEECKAKQEMLEAQCQYYKHMAQEAEKLIRQNSSTTDVVQSFM